MVYTYLNPAVALMGAGAVKEIGTWAKMLNAKKALIVSGKGRHGKALAEDIGAYLKEAGVDFAIFAGAEPNPTDISVHEGAAVYKKEACDMIVAVGGGSPMDCAKGIGIVATNGGEIYDYEGAGKVPKALPPFITVNTTAGTASEMTNFAVITDTRRHVKMALVDWKTTANVAINDPELMKSMPPALTAATGMDALTHAVEAYVSTIATPTTDAAALMAIQLISKWLRPAVANGDDMVARDMMAHAEYLAGIAFNNASLGYVHAMAHQLGGFYNLPHGVCNAVLLPHVEKFNLIAAPDRFVDIAKALGENVEGLSTIEAANKAIDAIKTLSVDVGIPAGVKELGAQEKDIPTLADNAMKDICGLTNPRRATKDEIIAIYRSAM
ncbi:iron-containing alcohol dehydrogenase [Methanofollis ethanolicus]|uniref:iron-containing alcohol dehydrogenase n=1 Tax=Methanofollis ethanolicus TaxID=488124 RepID=UPI0008370032|nr:iron-containing alcohol dehydrogenase [Methanofollis ethanolicus]